METQVPGTINQGVQDSSRFCYAIKKPSSAKSKQRNRKFVISKVKLPEGKPRQDLKFPEIDAINALFKSGAISFDEALAKVQVFRDSLYKARDAAKPTPVFNSVNQKILDDYWQAEYSDRDIVDPRNRYVQMQSAVEGVGHLSLAVASKSELQTAMDASFPKNNVQRTMVSRVNQILKFLGRGFVLRKKRKIQEVVRYLTLSEFEQVLPHLADPDFAKLAKAAWATGCRLGELFPLAPQDLKENHVWVETQLAPKSKLDSADLAMIKKSLERSDQGKRGQNKRKFEERATKNRKKRKAFLIKEGREWVKEWIALDQTTRMKQRTIQHAAKFKLACKKAFPQNPEKHLVFHDLRHSYSIHLLQVLGAPIQLVANCLANSVHVCETYYAGFVLTEPGLDFLERLSAKE